MDRTKLVAFYWWLGGFSLGLFCILSPEFVKPPASPAPLLDPRLEAILFAAFVPALPISIGIALWQGKVRPREREQEIIAMGRPVTEARLQACIDDLGRALLDGKGEGALRLCEKQAEMLEADSRLRWNRIYLMSLGPGRLPADPGRFESRDVALPNVLLQARILALLAVLCFLMTPFVFFAFYLLGDLFPWQPVKPGLAGAVFEAKACLCLSATGLVGWLGLKALLRREWRRKASLDPYQDRWREIFLERCQSRLEWFLQKGILQASSESQICRLARASIADALNVLDEVRKGRLLLYIRERGLSEVYDPSGAGLPRIALEARA